MKVESSEKIITSKDYSKNRLETLKTKLNDSDELKGKNNFCIYTTGSYGRYEASSFSDIDLFFISNDKEKKFSKISKTLIDSHIIQSCREMSFPEFSGDGEYLEVHNVNEIYDQLGSRNDDYLNFFTARILLLLESKCIHNEELYKDTIETTIDRYYKDFHVHEKNFKPVFLVNDVIRFWRTLCLNYEHSRNRKFTGNFSKEEIQLMKSEVHIKNLKLKFSRKLTCYSFLINVLYMRGTIKPQDIIEITKSTPLERLENASGSSINKADISALMSLYSWFLDITHNSKPELIKWISKKENRDDAFEKSREFSQRMFKLIMGAEQKDNLMYFLI